MLRRPLSDLTPSAINANRGENEAESLDEFRSTGVSLLSSSSASIFLIPKKNEQGLLIKTVPKTSIHARLDTPVLSSEPEPLTSIKHKGFKLFLLVRNRQSQKLLLMNAFHKLCLNSLMHKINAFRDRTNDKNGDLVTPKKRRVEEQQRELDSIDNEFKPSGSLFESPPRARRSDFASTPSPAIQRKAKTPSSIKRGGDNRHVDDARPPLAPYSTTFASPIRPSISTHQQSNIKINDSVSTTDYNKQVNIKGYVESMHSSAKTSSAGPNATCPESIDAGISEKNIFLNNHPSTEIPPGPPLHRNINVVDVNETAKRLNKDESKSSASSNVHDQRHSLAPDIAPDSYQAQSSNKGPLSSTSIKSPPSVSKEVPADRPTSKSFERKYTISPDWAAPIKLSPLNEFHDSVVSASSYAMSTLFQKRVQRDIDVKLNKLGK